MKVNQAMDTILQEFMQLAAIPRPSHHEEQVGAYLFQWALDHGFQPVRDALGDLIIDKPAAPGMETAPRVILQAHMDMVCVAAEGVSFDPLTDPIRVLNDGKVLTAQGTSLGADDGIGVAICLWALQDATLRHGPLRVILTVNEEDGMASADMPNQYLDAAYLINLDWEWLGSLCNSSAGGDFLGFERPALWTAAPGNTVPLQLRLHRLQGGHSGVDINRGRANAIVCIANALHGLQTAGIPFALADFHGGQAKNAIPSFAEAVLLVPADHAAAATQVLKDYEQVFQSGYGEIETGYEFIVQRLSDAPGEVLQDAITADLLRLLLLLPSNVHTMSPFVSGLTESSHNIGLLSMEQGKVSVATMERSCEHFRGQELITIARCAAGVCNFACILGDHAPAWAVNPKSKLTPLACREYQKLTGKDMVVEPVHGGLECGAFSEKNPALDMIAIGPSLQDVHSPKESCDIESVQVTAELIAAILEQLV
ncbi:MAG: beta-Ala-His dipeptidase [Oscillospiraceae bacterium]